MGRRPSVYLWSQTAAANIAALQPQARIVAILREPASFVRSLHLQMLQNHIETVKDLSKALSLEDARSRGKRIPRSCARPEALLYSEWVRYVEHLRRYHAAFPCEQVQALIYDDFRADNEQTARSVLRFLGVDDAVAIRAKEAIWIGALRSRSSSTRSLATSERELQLAVTGDQGRCQGAHFETHAPRRGARGTTKLDSRRHSGSRR